MNMHPFERLSTGVMVFILIALLLQVLAAWPPSPQVITFLIVALLGFVALLALCGFTACMLSSQISHHDHPEED